MNELAKDALIAALKAQIEALESERDYLRSVVASRQLVIPHPHFPPPWVPFVNTGQTGDPLPRLPVTIC